MGLTMYLDESGDHGLAKIDPNYPAFCLTGCVFDDDHYPTVQESLDALKLSYCGRTSVNLHSEDIRKHRGSFAFLDAPEKREAFYADVNRLISSLQFVILAVVILKQDHVGAYGARAEHPYHLALKFILERYSLLLKRCRKPASEKVIAESRGRTEDGLLKSVYEHYRQHGTGYRVLSNLPPLLWTERKESNIAGLQIADLAAYPIGAKVLHPTREQRAFDVLYSKFDCMPVKGRPSGKLLGCGLKIFPRPSAEHRKLWG